MSALLPGQSYPGQYLPPGATKYINVITVNGAPFLALFLPPTGGCSGGGSTKDAYIPTHYDYEQKRYVGMYIPIPGSTGAWQGPNVKVWICDPYVLNNVENNKKYAKFERANFVAGTQEYVPSIKDGYVDIINALYKKGEIDGLSAAKITPEVVAIVDAMLEEIQDGSKAMIGVDIAFKLFYGIASWSGFVRNAKGIDHEDTVAWLNVLLGNSNYDVVVKDAAYRYRTALQVELNRS